MTSNVNKHQILCVTLLVLKLEGRIGLYAFSEIDTQSDSLREGSETTETRHVRRNINYSSNGSYWKWRNEGEHKMGGAERGGVKRRTECGKGRRQTRGVETTAEKMRRCNDF